MNWKREVKAWAKAFGVLALALGLFILVGLKAGFIWIL
jgi:hypothetical protein